jgi:hypothetical protein
MATLRDLRYVAKDGTVLLTAAIARDVVEPDPARIAEVYGLEQH